MTVKNIYVAEDGTEFYDKTACEQYENNLRELRYKPLADYIVFRKNDGTIVPYSTVERNEYSAHFAEIKNIPYDDEDIERLWCAVMPYDLLCVSENSRCGWYWLNNDDRWVAFKDIETDYLYCKNKIALFENRG
jgi:hypothetical protein